MIEGKVVAYTGRKGCGKTLTMIKDAKKYYNRGWEVYSNVKTNFSKELTNTHIKNLNKESGLKYCVVVIDEIQVMFDSRRSMDKGNLTFSNFIQQIRKRGIKLLSTTQYLNTVDKRFIQHIDYLVKPKTEIMGEYKITFVSIYNYGSIEEDENGVLNTPDNFDYYYFPHKIYGLFDTRQMQV